MYYALLSVLAVGCNQSEVDSNIQPLEDGTGEFVFFRDSFERDDLDSGTYENKLFGYLAFIWDFGQPVVGSSYRNIAAVIMGDDKMGEAAHGNKALYFYGREGTSIHNIYLVTQAYDLSRVDLVDLEFDYLTISLNDSADVRDGVDEYLRLEVCTSSLENCGVRNGSFDFNTFESPVWMELFESDRALQNNALDGKNQVASDWNRQKVRINITNFNRKDQVIFRWTTRMRDGFVSNNINNRMVDGVGLDNIKGRAIDFINNNDDDPGTGTNTGGSTGGTTGSGSDDDGEITQEEPGEDIDPSS